MKNIYLYRSSKGKISNLETECSSCISNMSQGANHIICPITKSKRNQYLKDEKDDFLFCSEEIFKSNNKLRQRSEDFLSVLQQAASDLEAQKANDREEFKRYLHNLVTLNAKSIQSVYAEIDQQNFMKKSRDELMQAISNIIKEKPESIAKLIVDLLKNENLKKAEFATYFKIFKNTPSDISNFSPHQLILLVLNSFWSEFKEKEVLVKLGEYHGKTLIDFDSFVAIITHLFHNAEKYILPGSKLFIDFEETNNNFVRIYFRMISLKIHEDELSLVFNRGYSGKEPKRLKKSGEGLGLWVIQKLAEEMNSSIFLKADAEKAKRRNRMGIAYTFNVFELLLPRSQHR